MSVKKAKQVINEVKQFKVSDLHKHPSNPRTLKDTAYNTLKQSIEANPELLEARPLILSNRTGKNIVIGGNQRLQVVKDLGWLHVPCVLFPDMSEEKEREIMIRDNVSNGDWDWDKLANEWDSDLLNEWGLAVPDWESDQDFSDKNKELDLSSFEDIMELKLKFSKDDFFSVSQALDNIADQNELDSKESALKFLLGQDDDSEI